MRVLATHSIRQFPLHFPSRASPCAIRFRTSSTTFPLSVHRHVMGDLGLFTFKINKRLFVCLFVLTQQPPVGHGLLIHEVSKPHTTVGRTPLDE